MPTQVRSTFCAPRTSSSSSSSASGFSSLNVIEKKSRRCCRKCTVYVESGPEIQPDRVLLE